MAEVVGLLRGQHPAQLLLHLSRVLGAVGQAQQPGDADAVGVRHHHPGHVIHVAQDQVGRLPPHPGQLQQLLHGTGHPAPIVPQQHLSRQDDVPGLGPEEAGGVDIVLHLRHVRPGQGLQGGEPGVKGGGDLVHPLVGTLGGQTHGKQQLIILFILQGTQAVGIEGFQLLHDGPHLLRCFSHGGSVSFA